MSLPSDKTVVVCESASFKAIPAEKLRDYFKAPLTLCRFHTKTVQKCSVYTVPFSYPASNEDCCIRKYINVYNMPFSYDNISIPFSYENGIV